MLNIGGANVHWSGWQKKKEHEEEDQRSHNNDS